MEFLEDWSTWCSSMLDLNSNADCKQNITKKSKPITCFEDILHHVGGWGPFQWYLTLLNFLFIFFLGSVTYFPILTLFTPQHFCKIEDLQNKIKTLEEYIKLSNANKKTETLGLKQLLIESAECDSTTDDSIDNMIEK